MVVYAGNGALASSVRRGAGLCVGLVWAFLRSFSHSPGDDAALSTLLCASRMFSCEFANGCRCEVVRIQAPMCDRVSTYESKRERSRAAQLVEL